MGDRFYSQRDGKNGYSKTKAYTSTDTGKTTRKRRLKADIVKHICDLIGAGDLPSMNKMVIADLEKIEKGLKK